MGLRSYLSSDWVLHRLHRSQLLQLRLLPQPAFRLLLLLPIPPSLSLRSSPLLSDCPRPSRRSQTPARQSPAKRHSRHYCCCCCCSHLAPQAGLSLQFLLQCFQNPPTRTLQYPRPPPLPEMPQGRWSYCHSAGPSQSCRPGWLAGPSRSFRLGCLAGPSRSSHPGCPTPCPPGSEPHSPSHRPGRRPQ